MKNKIISILITVITLTFSSIIQAFASKYDDCENSNIDCYSCGENCYYEYTDNTLNIYGPMDGNTSGTIQYGTFSCFGCPYGDYIPDNITNLEISGHINISEYAFQFNENLENIVIGAGVQTIGSESFKGDYDLTRLIIGDDVTTIEDEAFNSNRYIEELIIGNSVETIGDYALAGLTLNTLLIPDSIQEIGEGAFNNTEADTIAIGEGVEDIGDSAFLGVTGTIMCPQEKIDLCEGKGSDNIYGYLKDSIGIYEIDGTFYSSLATMADWDNCSDYQDCKETKAQSMAGEDLCNTKQECLNLLDMVGDGNYTCGEGGEKNTIANCSAYAKTNNIELASLYDRTPLVEDKSEEEIIEGSDSEGTNVVDDVVETPSAPVRSDIRIYTIDEANAVAGKVNSVKIRYR